MLLKILKLLGLSAVWYLTRSVISGTRAAGDEVSFNDCEVELDLTPASSSYANIDSWSTNLTCDPRAVASSEIYTFTGDPIVYTGNQTPMNVTIEIVYTEGSTDPFVNLFNLTQGVALDARWGPAGAGSGGRAFTTTGGKFLSLGMPQGDAESGAPTVLPVIIRASNISMGTIA